MAYKMVAERDDQRVIKERASALILLANARVWESEGWQVMITDAEGKEFDPAGFEKLLGPGYAWSPQEPLALQPQYRMMAIAPQAEEASTEQSERTADTAADTEIETLESDDFSEVESIEQAEHHEELASFEETDEYDDFEPFDETEELEDELEAHH